jgi:hypothetical protein
MNDNVGRLLNLCYDLTQDKELGPLLAERGLTEAVAFEAQKSYAETGLAMMKLEEHLNGIGDLLDKMVFSGLKPRGKD